MTKHRILIMGAAGRDFQPLVTSHTLSRETTSSFEKGSTTGGLAGGLSIAWIMLFSTKSSAKAQYHSAGKFV